MKEIKLSKQEALIILQVLSLIDGYLMSIEGSVHVAEQLHQPTELLVSRLAEDD